MTGLSWKLTTAWVLLGRKVPPEHFTTKQSTFGLVQFRNRVLFVFCSLIDVWINSKIYLNVSELIMNYLQKICIRQGQNLLTVIRLQYFVFMQY